MDSGLLVYLSLVPRLLSSFLSHTATVCNKKVERSQGTRLVYLTYKRLQHQFTTAVVVMLDCGWLLGRRGARCLMVVARRGCCMIYTLCVDCFVAAAAD